MEKFIYVIKSSNYMVYNGGYNSVAYYESESDAYVACREYNANSGWSEEFDVFEEELILNSKEVPIEDTTTCFACGGEDKNYG